MGKDTPVRARLSPQEERIERIRQTAGFFLGPCVFLIIYLIPIPSISERAHVLASILGLVIIYWISEAIPIPATALLGAGLCVILRVAPAKKVLAPFADPIVFLFIGSFIIARAMGIHGLDKRFAVKVLSLKFIRKHPFRLLIACGFITATLSMWISNTASTAIMLPIVIGILRTLEQYTGKDDERNRKYRIGFMLIIAYSATIGGIATPVGTPPNLIAIGMIDSLANFRISFFHWMTFAVPIVIFLFIMLFGVIGFLFPAPEGNVVIEDSLLVQREKWTRGEIFTLLSFATAVTLWVLPGIVAIMYGSHSEIYKHVKGILNGGIVAILAALLLFILPVDRKKRQFAMSWEEAMKIDWGTILLFGGGLALGKLMFDTGLANAIGAGLVKVSGVESVWSITALAIIVSSMVTETTSNTASASMIVPIIIAIAKAAGVSPVPPALGAAIGASLGFTLPVSTPPNAIVYGSGMVPILSMAKTGIILDVIGFIIIFTGLRILCPLLGLM